MWNNLWWIVRFNRKVNVTQYVGSEIPPIPYVGPYWTRAEALKILWQWEYKGGLKMEIIKIKNPDETTLCGWGSSLHSSKDHCFNMAEWAIEGDYYCDFHKQEISNNMEKQCGKEIV